MGNVATDGVNVKVIDTTKPSERSDTSETSVTSDTSESTQEDGLFNIVSFDFWFILVTIFTVLTFAGIKRKLRWFEF